MRPSRGATNMVYTETESQNHPVYTHFGCKIDTRNMQLKELTALKWKPHHLYFKEELYLRLIIYFKSQYCIKQQEHYI
jgi:hypothetical protein